MLTLFFWSSTTHLKGLLFSSLTSYLLLSLFLFHFFPLSVPFSPADKKQRGILGIVVSTQCIFFSSPAYILGGFSVLRERFREDLKQRARKRGNGGVVCHADVSSWRTVLHMCEVKRLGHCAAVGFIHRWPEACIFRERLSALSKRRTQPPGQVGLLEKFPEHLHHMLVLLG